MEVPRALPVGLHLLNQICLSKVLLMVGTRDCRIRKDVIEFKGEFECLIKSLQRRKSETD